MSLNQRNSSQANVGSEQEFETLLRRSEEYLKLQRSSATKAETRPANSLKIVPPLRRRDSAA